MSDPDANEGLARALELLQTYRGQPGRWKDDKAFLDDPQHQELRSILEGLLFDAGPGADQTLIADFDQTIDASVSLQGLAETLAIDIDRLDQTAPMESLGSDQAISTSQIPTLLVKSRSIAHESVPADQLDSDYQAKQLIGKGGMGTVHLAKQLSLGREVALKRLHEANRSKSSLQAGFLFEATMTGRLEHPNIIPIYDVGREENGDLFYVMKNIRGLPWTKSIDKLSFRENLDILLRICDAIAFAHAQGIVHRDLKPDNIMIGEFGEVLVLDWGLAVALEGEMSRATVPGGTPAYMAPEMLNPPCEICRQSDVYLLGALLFEILTGKPPHGGKSAKEALLTVTNNIIQEYDPQRVQIHDASGELLAVSMKAMESQAANRHDTVLEFQESIKEFQSHQESWALSTRAQKELEAAEKTKDYTVYSRSVFGFEEALNLWAGNQAAQNGLQQSRLSYANCAETQGDYDLGLSLLDMKNPEHKQNIARLQQARQERDARQVRLKKMKRGLIGAAISVFLIVALASFWINEARIVADTNAKIAQQRSEQLQQVTEFQSEQLASINAYIRGNSIKDGLQKKIVSSAERRGLGEGATRDAIEHFQDLVEWVDFTGLALDTLDEHLFQRSLEAIELQFASQPQLKAQLMQTVAILMKETGLLNRAMEPQLAAFEVRDRELGKDHQDTLFSLEQLANLIKERGQLDESESLHHEILAARESALGENHPETLRSIANLGDLKGRQGKYSEAVDYLEEALSRMDLAIGEKHPDRLEAMGDLGVISMRTQDWQTALTMFSFVYPCRRDLLGEKHPLSIKTQSNYGACLVHSEDKNNLLPGEQTLLQALNHGRQVLGDEHRTTMMALRELIHTYGINGRYDEAERYLKEGLQTCERVFGPDHPETIQFLYYHGETLFEMGSYTESEIVLNEVNSRQERLFGEEAVPSLASKSLLSALLMKRGDLEKAGNILKAVVPALLERCGEDHLQTHVGRSRLGRWYALKGKSEVAKDYLERAVQGFQDFPDNHPDKKRASYYLAILLDQVGQIQKAFQLVKSAVSFSFEQEMEYQGRTALLNQIRKKLQR